MPLSHSKSTDVSNTERLIIELIPFLKNALLQSFRLYGRRPSQDETEEHNQGICTNLKRFRSDGLRFD
jgi:hypothetical protein